VRAIRQLRAARFELAVFLMDFHGGQWSRGYRLLCRLHPEKFSASFCEEMRDTEMYSALVAKYSNKV
jgi:hypothetical protein